MQLNKFTDYALRILLYISKPRDLPYTIAEIAKDLHVSQNHLVKIVHFMAKQNWLITSRGKGGGIRLNPETANIGLGLLVRTLQGDAPIVECNSPPCVLRRDCGLKSILDDAMAQFYQHLNRYTVADVIQQSSSKDHNLPLIDLINL
ncbi:RrF2 family transcriptional regulator [Acinetobacter sp. ANC 4648]|uniref:RrF2 family transcriptional regulator n=1 Tax=Acinetobacter sp. ANC 4648 TaxID=1977875 RepID=UPI000A3582C7|nr:Rrf2 family transcriptional regulator [Acinetobacter sp. ANC 4648]OTG84846.1 transcriptional regulator [Acinetobacter sp. ANC 4648]